MLEQYLKDASKQVDDDLVFPQQDWQTLLMNIENALKESK